MDETPPGTVGAVRRADRMLAVQLYQRGVAVSIIENAFVLAPEQDFGHYFLPVIEEVTLGMSISPDYFQYLRQKLARIQHPIRRQPIEHGARPFGEVNP